MGTAKQSLPSVKGTNYWTTHLKITRAANGNGVCLSILEFKSNGIEVLDPMNLILL
uniref:Uncharacterized protein n=1 Tax=Nelumbo nucifera TaxID=4432 RepID=A0A822ZDP7_NELNU|nr:TPA_asm: hypothetical protein HUJ06_014041 [Nelumbo nucifera]